jgi:hypothetical protein
MFVFVWFTWGRGILPNTHISVTTTGCAPAAVVWVELADHGQHGWLVQLETCATRQHQNNNS